MFKIRHPASRRSTLIAESDSGFEATRVLEVPSRKTIAIVSSFSIPHFKKFHLPFREKETIVFALESEHATTAETTIRLNRDSSSSLITEQEMDHLVFKALWEFLHRYRSWAGKKMGITDLSLVLAAVEVRDVLLGTHHIFNPVGFKGDSVTIRIRGTFISRELLPVLERMKSWGNVRVVEEGIALADAIQSKEYFVLCAGRKTTSVLFKGYEETRYVEEYPWGTDCFARALGESFELDYETASRLLARVSAGMVSEPFARYCNVLIRRQYDELLGMVDEKALKKKTGAVHPELFFHFKNLAVPEFLTSKIQKKFVRIDERLLREEYIFETAKGVRFDPVTAQVPLALLIYAEHAPKYELLNKLLKRRARWLIPHFSLQ